MNEQPVFAQPDPAQSELEEQVFLPEHLPRLYPDFTHASFPVGLVSEMAQAEDLAETFDCVTFWQQRMFGADRASIVIDDGNGMLAVWALRGSSSSRMDKSVPVGRGRLGRAFQNGQLILSCDLAHCTEPDGMKLYEAGLRRSINAPLKVNRRCIGAINLCFEDPYAADRELAFRLQVFANWVAPIIRYQQDLLSSAKEARTARARSDAAVGESQAKTSFIANISHEIRTPLNGILGMAQLLASDARDEQQAEMVDTILSSGNELLKILNDVIDISRIDAGKMSVTPVRNSPHEHFARIVRLWQQKAHSGGLDLELKIDDNVPGCVIYDATRVEQCITNLISNAIKFTDIGGVRVEVSADVGVSETMVSVSVADTGNGINPDELDALFEPFRQADQSTRRQAQGSGLGLSICRRVARLMGGDVTATSAPGVGSVFVFSFEGRNAVADGIIDPAPESQVLADPKAVGLEGKRVLVVEDIPTNRLVVEMFLTHLGAIVEHAEHGGIAMEILAERSFDLILLDMHMPVMDGAETIAAIRAGPPALRETPVIALTADALHGDRERHLSMGLNGYLPKPIDAKAMVAEIHRLGIS